MGLTTKLLVCVLLNSIFILNTVCFAQEQAFNNLLHNVKKHYLDKNNWNCANFVKNHPDAIAAMIGNAAFQQMTKAPSATEGRRRVNSLMTSAKTYFAALAKAASYRTKDGKRVTGDTLFNDAVYYARGEGQDTIAKTMNVYPGQIPQVFNMSTISRRPELLALVTPKITSRPQRRPRPTKRPPSRPRPLKRPAKTNVALKPRPIRKTIGGGKATLSTVKSSPLPTGRICFVGQSSIAPSTFAVAIDGKKQKAVHQLTLSGHSQVVFGPATWDECWQWIGKQKDGPAKMTKYCVALDDYITPVRHRVVKASNTRLAQGKVKEIGFTKMVHGPASYRSCWEYIALQRMKN